MPATTGLGFRVYGVYFTLSWTIEFPSELKVYTFARLMNSATKLKLYDLHPL